MNSIQLFALRNNYKMNNIKNIKNNPAANKNVSSNYNLAKASAANYKANYMVNFKGGMQYSQTNDNKIGTVNHQTAFFREPATDEIVQNYILDNFKDEDEVVIVSGACSTGEEAKSYAMMLDSLKDKLKIKGFDISPEIIKEALKNDTQLVKEDENSYIGAIGIGLDSENILMSDDIDDLTDYQKTCRSKFEQYYRAKGKEYTVPVFPGAKEEYEKLKATMEDDEELEKLKNQSLSELEIIKKESPELAQYLGDMDFETIMWMNLTALETKAEAFKTVKDFEADENCFDNCTFTQGDVMNLEKLYKPESVNVLLYRNALYHTLCEGNHFVRFMMDDSEEKMDLIAKQMNKVLKTNGLVVFGEMEALQGIDSSVIKKVMENNGFKLLETKELNESENIWIKV